MLSTAEQVQAAAAAVAGERCHVATSLEDLVATVARVRARAVIVDVDPAEETLARLATLPTRRHLLVLLVARDPTASLPHGADAVVFERCLEQAIVLVSMAARIHERPLSLDRLLGVSLLDGSLDQALDDAANLLASGFGVDRCLISVRGDSSGGAATGTRTWSSLTWSHAASRCQAAVAANATVIAPLLEDPDAPPESYLAVPLETPLGRNGFLGLVFARPRIFTRELRGALQAVAARLVAELGWRVNHERAADELDQLVNGPGRDPLIGCWNRNALTQLTAGQVSLARRTGAPLSIAVLDVIDLQGINTRLGLEIGDRVIARIADAVKATVREEDLVGRWSGDELAVVMYGTDPKGANRAAERLLATLAARPLELAEDELLDIRVTIGIATLQPTEGGSPLLIRAAHAAKQAQDFDNATTFNGIRAASGLTAPPRSAPSLDEATEEVTSTIAGTYRLLHEISRGGMGVVYRAEDRALERPVAIKMLRPDLAEDPKVVERFRHEAAMLAHIQHANLVQIYSFGSTNGDSYFVMELVEGESLEQAFARHRSEGTAMSLLELPIVIEQIASALDALHDRGIVHRDVKPANVIRDPFRARSVLVDVGIARRYGQDAASAGTPGFVAPEVFAAEEITARADVYGLATTAYAMLTLQRPWGDGDLVTILSRQIHEQPRPPSELRPELAAIDDVLLRGMSRDPERRQSSAGGFARELAEALATLHPRPARERQKPVSQQVPIPRGEVDESARTRGVVFRSVTRAVGAREAERLRDMLGGRDPDLARALHDTAPLGWLPTDQFLRLLTVAPEHVGRDRASLARDIARATVRASFRRFFPASAATLVPERTLSAIRNVWGRYQSWGTISSMAIHPTEVMVRLADTLEDPALCAWTSGLLEQLVVLSGGRAAAVEHTTCATTGAEACLFRVTWQRAE